MKRPIWHIALLSVATFGLYVLYWWPKSWEHLGGHRLSRLVAFVAFFALAWVPALGWGGWLGLGAALGIVLHGQASVNRSPDLIPVTFSLPEKVILALAGVVAGLAAMNVLAGS